METMFIKVLNLSITASWLILAVLLLRQLLKGAPKGIRCLLWALVGIRLLCPFSLESVLSLVPSGETVSPDILYVEAPAIQSGIPFLNSTINPVISETLATTPAASINPAQVLNFIASFIWLIGIGVLLLYSVLSYLRLWHKLRTAVLYRDNIWQSEAVSSPFVLGILRPRIYLPFQIDESSLPHIIAHEEAHIKRRDHWIKPFAFLILTVYWFNPLIWLSYILLCRDIELACDERVIKTLEAPEKKAYSTTLLRYSVSRALITACPLAFGEVGVKQRVKSILHYKKPGFWIIVVAILSCIVLGICFLTVPKSQDQSITLNGHVMESARLWSFGQSIPLPQDLGEDLALALQDYDMEDATTYDGAPYPPYDWAVTFLAQSEGARAISYTLLQTSGQYLLVEEIFQVATSEYRALALPDAFSESPGFQKFLTGLDTYLYRDWPGEIYERRTAYIGDNTAVTQLLDTLIVDGRFTDYSITLETDEAPYGVIVTINGNRDPGLEDRLNQVMFQTGYAFLALVENAEFFQWDCTIDQIEYRHTLTPQDYAGVNLKDFGASPDQFQILWQNLLETGAIPLPEGQQAEIADPALLYEGVYSPVEVLHLSYTSSNTPDYHLMKYQDRGYSIYGNSFQFIDLHPALSSMMPTSVYIYPQYVPFEVGDSIALEGSYSTEDFGRLDVSQYTNKAGYRVVSQIGEDTGYRFYLMDDEVWVGHCGYRNEDPEDFTFGYLYKVEPRSQTPYQAYPIFTETLQHLTEGGTPPFDISLVGSAAPQGSLPFSLFLPYAYEEVGSGFMVYQFPVDGGSFSLTISSPLPLTSTDVIETPIYLTHIPTGDRIDILQELATDFIFAHREL